MTQSIQFSHPDGRYVVVNGHKLWVEEHGSGDPVLMLAGLGPAGSHVIFHPHFDDLAKTNRVIYVDLFGRGKSDYPENLEDISFQSDVLDVAALISALGCAPCHLYGFSYGGLIAQALALDHAENVKSVTLANSLHSAEMWQKNHENLNREIENQAPETWQKIMELKRDGLKSTHPKIQALFAPMAKLVRFYNPNNAQLIATEDKSRNVELYPIFCGEDVDFIIGGEVAKLPDFRPRLKDIKQPMLVLAGRYDRALYPSLQKQFVDYAPNAEFKIMEKSGSFSHIEESDKVCQLLREFWQNLC